MLTEESKSLVEPESMSVVNLHPSTRDKYRHALVISVLCVQLRQLVRVTAVFVSGTNEALSLSGHVGQCPRTENTKKMILWSGTTPAYCDTALCAAGVKSGFRCFQIQSCT